MERRNQEEIGIKEFGSGQRNSNRGLISVQPFKNSDNLATFLPYYLLILGAPYLALFSSHIIVITC